MKVLLTGSTGFLGSNIASQLINAGIEVRALCRGINAIPNLPQVNLVPGDLMDPVSLIKAVNNCDAVIHAAGLVALWNYDRSLFTKVNFRGTQNLLKACEAVGVNRFVHVSSAGTIGPTTAAPAPESYIRARQFSCEYIISKQLADKEVESAGLRGMHISIVYPSRMYGPGPLNVANGITNLVNKFRKGKWFMQPPFGHVIGSYNHVEHVAAGVVKALIKGNPGSRYLLAGDNISYDTFFEILRSVTGSRHRLIRPPYPLLYLLAFLAENYSKVNRNYFPEPNVKQVQRFRYHYAFDSSKAIDELNYTIVPFAEGMHRTLDWLKKNDK